MCTAQPPPGVEPVIPGYIRGIANEISPVTAQQRQQVNIRMNGLNGTESFSIMVDDPSRVNDRKYIQEQLGKRATGYFEFTPGAKSEVRMPNPAYIAEVERRTAAAQAEQQAQQAARQPIPPPPLPEPSPPPAPPATPAQPEARSRGDARPGSRRTRRASNAPGTGRSSLVIPVSLGGLAGGAGLSIPR